MGGGRQLPEPPPNSENDPTLQFTTFNVTLPQGAGKGCYIAPNLAVGIPLDKDLVLTCDPGWYCPNLDKNNASTLPVYCPPSAGCSVYRLSSLPCSPQGLYEPAVCKPGFYCPTYLQMFPCPAGHFCPTGSTKPTACGFLSSCPAGSVSPLPFLPVVLMGILDVCLFVTIISIKIKQGAFNRMAKSFTMFSFLKGAGYALEQNAKAAMNDAPAYKVAEPFNPSVVSAEMAKLVTAFHSAMGQRELRMNFKFDDLSLTLKNGKKVLEGVTGEIKSKRMTAVMGPSGAGKTTFMNVLMGKVPRTGGRLYINGAEAEVHLYRKIIGYVPQEDIMLRELTVREVVLHSARVRLPRSWTSKQIEDHVDNVLKALNLSHVANSYIGDETTRGISGGQRKRVNIGMELAAAPLAIFLDEPTSGLDATAALEVCDILSAIAHLGLTIVSVIHQPRIEIFKKFDDVLMIAPGGKVAYLGPIPMAQRYFESLGFDFDPTANMSDVLMDILSGKAKNNRYQFGPQQLVAAWENRKVRDFLLEYPLGAGEEGEEYVEETGSAMGGIPGGVVGGVNNGLQMRPASYSAGGATMQGADGAEAVGHWLVGVNPVDEDVDDEYDDEKPMPAEPTLEIEAGMHHAGGLASPMAPERSFSKGNSLSRPTSATPMGHDTDSIHSINHHVQAGYDVHRSSTRASLQQGHDGGFHAREGSIAGSLNMGPGVPARRVPSQATIAQSIIESLSRGVPLGNASSSDPEDTRMMDIEFHRMAPQVVKERGASVFKQFVYCHNRALVQQSRALGALVLEIFVAMFAGMLMGVSTQGKVKELFNGIYAGIYVLLSPAYLDLVSLYGLLLGIAIALAGSPAGVKVFGEEKPVFWREAASGHNKFAYFLGKTVATIYRLVLTALHFTAMYMLLARPMISVYEHYALVFLQFWGVYGMSCIVSLVVRRENASLLAVVVGLFAAVFCGYGPNLVQAEKWKLLWVFELSFNKWAAEAHYASSLSFYKGVYNIQFSADLFGYSLTQVTRDYIFCFLLGVGTRMVGFFLLILLNRDKQR
ncbi:hypothetical protein HDU96_000472 [Phlyctochytrium bullatum]|nr:hypothetical protein HDU96_000472 [Phlyctochytrium bullatum]